MNTAPNTARSAPPPRVHWLQHAAHEGLGCIGPWLRQKGYAVSGTRLFAGEALPAPETVDWLIVMGGPMNIYQHQQYPWLSAEKDFINDVCVTNKKVLGICLGAQLLSDVLGGKTTKNECDEIGFFDVFLTDDGRKCQLINGLPTSFAAFHWHGDRFAMPQGCPTLIKSDACVNQAFVWGDRLLGLQFHLEVTQDDARLWLEQEPPAAQRYVQNAEEILRDPARFELNNRLMIHVLEQMAAITPDATAPAAILGAGISGCGEIAGRPARR